MLTIIHFDGGCMADAGESNQRAGKKNPEWCGGSHSGPFVTSHCQTSTGAERMGAR
ncbi:protein of unknown function [Pseudomonas sp. JV551A1]|nr:protein of unknown function [Pseudomonas sp. JV551A1]